jgi:hypothetical protein
VGSTSAFSIGDVVLGSLTSAQGIITALSATVITVQLINSVATGGKAVGFSNSDTAVGPAGAQQITAVANTTPQPVSAGRRGDELIPRLAGIGDGGSRPAMPHELPGRAERHWLLCDWRVYRSVHPVHQRRGIQRDIRDRAE